MHLGPWEIAAFGGLWIGAFILAAEIGLTMAPTLRANFPVLERITGSAIWGFTPLFLLTISGLIFLAHNLLPEQKQASVASQSSPTVTVDAGVRTWPADEKARLRPIVGDLEEIVVTKTQRPLTAAKEMGNLFDIMWIGQVGAPPPSEIISKCDRIRQQLVEIDEKIYRDIIPNHQHFSKELTPLVSSSQSIQELGQALVGISSGLHVMTLRLEKLQIKDNDMSSIVNAYLSSHRFSFPIVVQQFERWISTSSDRIEKMKQDLR